MACPAPFTSELHMLYGRKSIAPSHMKKPALQTPSIQSLDRGLVILEAVAKASDPVPIRHLTDLLGVDRTSVFRLANTLRRRGYLANPNGRKEYTLGPSVYRLPRKHPWSDMLIRFNREHVKELAAKTGETTHLAVREGKQTFFIDHYLATKQLLMVSGQVGEFSPLYCTAHGKALLAIACNRRHFLTCIVNPRQFLDHSFEHIPIA